MTPDITDSPLEEALVEVSVALEEVTREVSDFGEVSPEVLPVSVSVSVLEGSVESANMNVDSGSVEVSVDSVDSVDLEGKH